MRLIDADDTRDDFAKTVCAECLDDKNNIRANRIIDAFDDLPTVNAKPVRHGRLVNSNNPCYFKFSCCGAKVDKTVTLRFDYCYHCGAKMEGGEDIS